MILERVYSVGQINTYIKNLFLQDFVLSRVQVKGEVSNCKYHPSGHIYFSLKDESGAVACVMFAGNRKGLAFSMKNGDRVVVAGSVAVYERDGKYQIYAKSITLEGIGLLYERFDALKKELEEMGMFAPEYKQPIPKQIHTLGVVTAPAGAALQDIRNVAYRRNPYLQIILSPALVQGEGAKESIVRAVKRLDTLHPDVMIVGRGGGSMEDLWAFNEECVARAIFECRTPVISAVGHEVDFTIADFTADLRAPTPSAAAELAVADVSELLERMRAYRTELLWHMENRIGDKKKHLEYCRKRLRLLSPENQIREKRQRLLECEDTLRRGMQQQIQGCRHRLELDISKLDGLSPLEKLKQGFSYTEKSNGRAVMRIAQVSPGEALQIQVTDGTIAARVESVCPVKRG